MNLEFITIPAHNNPESQNEDDRSPLLSPPSETGSNFSEAVVYIHESHSGTVLSSVINLSNTILGAGYNN